jgi:hypothetical protein
MKILRKNNEFKKMPDKSIDDVLKINSYIKDGWKYCPKSDYKNFYNQNAENEPTKEKTKRK